MTDKNLFPNMSPSDRKMALEQQAYRIEQSYSFTKFFTDQEIDEFRRSITGVMIRLSTLEEDFKEIKDNHNDQVKPLKEEVKELLHTIKHKSTMITDEVFLFDDQENKVMSIYDRTGTLVDSRPLRPDERQLHILHATGSDQSE